MILKFKDSDGRNFTVAVLPLTGGGVRLSISVTKTYSTGTERSILSSTIDLTLEEATQLGHIISTTAEVGAPDTTETEEKDTL